MLTILYVLTCPAIGFAIGSWRGRPIIGLVLGSVLGILGCAIVALLPERERNCATCGRRTAHDIVRCSRCANRPSTAGEPSATLADWVSDHGLGRAATPNAVAPMATLEDRVGHHGLGRAAPAGRR